MNHAYSITGMHRSMHGSRSDIIDLDLCIDLCPGILPL